MRKTIFVMILISAFFFGFGCQQDETPVETENYKTGFLACDQDYPFCQVGIASYYNDKYTGKKTASGEKYDPKAMTAAHREHPFGTKLKVTNEVGVMVTVTVNDRGPFVRGRILDVSRAAAEKLGMINAGWQRVKINKID